MKYYTEKKVKELLKQQRDICAEKYKFKIIQQSNIEDSEPKLIPDIDILPSDRQLIKAYHLGWGNCLKNKEAIVIEQTKEGILKEIKQEIE